MRAGRRWATAAWVLPATGAAAIAWTAAVPIKADFTAARGTVAPTNVTAMPYRSDSLARQIVLHDLFRANRQPAAVSYDPVRAGSPVQPGLPPKPQLALTGIVWGAVPEAVLEGLPGTNDPRVVRIGDAFDKLQVRGIGRHHVVIVGMDTVWTLSVREPWR